MSAIRLTEQQHIMAWHHMFDKPGEHFVFFLAKWTFSNSEPIFIVQDVHLVPDEYLTSNWNEYNVDLDGILAPINKAVKGNYCLIEGHNHSGDMPRFSRTDRMGFEEFTRYIHDSLPNRPYAATVWGDDSIYGEYFLGDGTFREIRSITVVGSHLHQLVSRDDDGYKEVPTYDRQLAWFGQSGQKQIQRTRVAVVGCGGTGSHVVQNLAFLGCDDFILVDPDHVELTNMNRLVTAAMADLDTPKAAAARRLIRAVNPSANVTVIEKPLQTSESLDSLKDVDVIFGCVDNDGARLVLNDFAVAYRIPYFDVATGIEPGKNGIDTIGGRVSIVLPNHPCLNCMHEIDNNEASYFLSSHEDQHNQIQRGYISGIDIPAPSVVSLNAVVSSVAINEFAVLISGIRGINVFTQYDLLGNISGGNIPSQRLSPMLHKKRKGCVTCSHSGSGDTIFIERYSVS